MDSTVSRNFPIRQAELVGNIPFACELQKSDNSAAMRQTLAIRIDKRLKELGIGPIEAAVKVPDLERNYIRDLLEGKKRSFSQAKAPLVAKALHWSLAELNGADHPQYRPIDDVGDTVRVPVLDYVSAGTLSAPASQIQIDDLPLMAVSGLGRRGEFFGLKVIGDSVDRIAPEGAIVIANRADRALMAEKLYVFLVGGETTIKLWQPASANSPAYLAPHSWNPTNKPIFFKRRSDVEVIGRIKRVIIDL